ncbi:MAG: hypothetical protein Q7T97_11795 [Burkholderiaceae bacterium]|nr:hypothetical protein [Burkholderiaceae bacterium]
MYFAEFLAATGVFERWVSACPLAYSSGNAPTKRDVLGTLMLGLLAGHRRYAHITAPRGDAVAAQALGMNKVVSEDALRRALERIDLAASTAWMRPALLHSVREALDKPWVLDIDASIKPLYGRQEGAELGYNPGKPGRPSHVLHKAREFERGDTVTFEGRDGRGMSRPCTTDRLHRSRQPTLAERAAAREKGKQQVKGAKSYSYPPLAATVPTLIPGSLRSAGWEKSGAAGVRPRHQGDQRSENDNSSDADLHVLRDIA